MLFTKNLSETSLFLPAPRSSKALQVRFQKENKDDFVRLLPITGREERFGAELFSGMRMRGWEVSGGDGKVDERL